MRDYMSRGNITSYVASYLSKELSNSNFVVYCAHKSGKLDQNTIFGKIKSQLLLNNDKFADLSELDIVIVDISKKQIFGLIEIEETTNKPKVLFGDAFAVLFGEMICIPGDQRLQVDNQAIMIIMAHNKTRCDEDSRINFLNREVNKIKNSINTSNARLKQIIFECYVDEKELISKIRENINRQFVEIGYKIVLH
jgi:hypothetical protein